MTLWTRFKRFIFPPFEADWLLLYRGAVQLEENAARLVLMLPGDAEAKTHYLNCVKLRNNLLKLYLNRYGKIP